MKVFEAFAGYGGWSLGFKKAGIKHEVIGFSEVDKYAIQVYTETHGNIPNFGDITKIHIGSLPDFDVLCASPPCQSFSIAGKGEGANDTKGRGRLFEHTIEIMRVKQPRVAIFENVKGLVSKRHFEYFLTLTRSMMHAGYQIYWKVLNTKEHGLPQNRERVFIVCFRNDIYNFGEFKFPEKEPLTLFLKDILEDNVEEKYFLSDQRIASMLKDTPQLSYAINANYSKGTSIESYCERKRRQLICINPLRNNMKQTYFQNRIYDNKTCFPSLTNTSPLICHNLQPRSKDRPSLLKCPCPPGSDLPSSLALSKDDGTTYTIDTKGTNGVEEIRGKIRRLTPTECFRLQGVNDTDLNFDGISDTQKYKLAGNGLSINVVSKLLAEVFKCN
jgi:DNA (cytosine-5)-methyltransferase 1